MGNITSDLIQQLRLGNDWQVIDRTDHFSNVVRDSDGFQGEEYIVPFDSRLSLYEQLELFCYRRAQNIGLVKIYGVQVLELDVTMCSTERSLRVVTQHLPRRLSQLYGLTQEQCLYVLIQLLRGYRQLVRRYGPLTINQDMIAFTQQGRVRCWCNPNFAMNHPRPEMESLESDESIMVMELLEIVELHSQGRKLPNHLLRLFLQQQSVDIHQAIRLLEYYRDVCRLAIPDRVDLTRIEEKAKEQERQLEKSTQPITKKTITTTTYTHQPDVSRIVFEGQLAPLQQTAMPLQQTLVPLQQTINMSPMQQTIIPSQPVILYY